MLLQGIVSVTHRPLDIAGVVNAAVAAGLYGIEWGGDIHVPHGDITAAQLARRLCEQNSLKIYSYGSYYRCDGAEPFGEVLDTALALGTKNIRVWAGRQSSEALTVDEYNALLCDIRRICALCKPHGVTISFEWHGGTATDTPQSAIKLISDIGADNAKLYWQPNQNKDFDFNLRSLIDALPYISNVHVFAWSGRDKFPLEQQWREWSEYIRVLRRASGTHCLLLEFVPDGTVEETVRDAATLRSILNADIPQIISRLHLDIPLTSDRTAAAEILRRRVDIAKSDVTLKNSLTVHPMEGFDALPDGSPSELTERRYRRMCASGASLVWFEAIAVQNDAKSSPHQLMLTSDNLDSYKRLIDALHAEFPDVILIAQLTHSGRFSKPDGVSAPVIAYHNPILNRTLDIDPSLPVVSDDYLDRLELTFTDAARLAYAAGFDGVDIKCCHRYLMNELLSAYNRAGKYGGCYENRTRLFKNIVRNVSKLFADKKDFIISSRYGIYDAISYPYGFDCGEDTKAPLLDESVKLMREISALGVGLVDITMGTPYFNPHVNRPYSRGGYTPLEHPLVGVERLISGGASLKRAVPDVTYIGTGYSYLGAYAPLCAAAAIERGDIDAVGFGRLAFAYDTFALDMLDGRFDEHKGCITCGKCTEIMRAGGTAGCPVRDCEIYAPIYRKYCMSKA